MVLRQQRDRNDVLIVDASKHFKKEGKNNKLQATDIKRITDTVIARQARPKFAKVVSKQAIRDNDYNLNIPRYVDSSDDTESWDLHATMLGGIPETEIATLSDYWQALPALQQALFKPRNEQYADLNIAPDQLKQQISQHPNVQAFQQAYTQAFAGFDHYLITQLITSWQSVNRKQQEANLSQDLFQRLKPIALVDPYAAYQLLNDYWQIISTDLEILQTEGFAASKQVAPNMVIKKKNGKDTEVQDGWLGHVLPFELVQQSHLQTELQALQAKQTRLADIRVEYEAILDGLSEEDKEADTIKDSKDGFNNAAVAKEAKQINAELKANGTKADSLEAESYEASILNVNDLINEEKILKRAVKTDSETLHLLTKSTIEGLNDEQVNALLEAKWITPLMAALKQLPDAVINDLTQSVQRLADKYATTYADVANDIKTTEQTLAAMLDDLTGNEFDQQGLAELQKLLNG